jgi:hypothetical protein
VENGDDQAVKHHVICRLSIVDIKEKRKLIGDKNVNLE